MISVRSLDYCKSHFEEFSKTDLKLKEVFHNYKRHCYNQSKGDQACWSRTSSKSPAN